MKCSSFNFVINALHEMNWVWNCEVLPKVTQRLVWRRMRTQGELKVEKSENQWGLRNLWAHLLCCVPWPLFSNLEWDHSNWVMDFTAGIPKFHSPTKKKKKKIQYWVLQEKTLPAWQSVFTRQGAALQMKNFSFEFVTGKGFQRSSQSFKVLSVLVSRYWQ